MRSATLSLLAFIVGVLLGGLGAYLYVDARWSEAEAKRIADEQKQKLESAEVTHEVESKAKEVEVRIQTVFRDRIVYRDREVPREVRDREDAECVVPDRFVRMWNTANEAVVPEPARTPDASAARAVDDEIEGGREALGHRGAEREGSGADASGHRATEGTDRVGARAAEAFLYP